MGTPTQREKGKALGCCPSPFCATGCLPNVPKMMSTVQRVTESGVEMKCITLSTGIILFLLSTGGCVGDDKAEECESRQEAPCTENGSHECDDCGTMWACYGEESNLRWSMSGIPCECLDDSGELHMETGYNEGPCSYSI